MYLLCLPWRWIILLYLQRSLTHPGFSPVVFPYPFSLPPHSHLCLFVFLARAQYDSLVLTRKKTDKGILTGTNHWHDWQLRNNKKHDRSLTIYIMPLGFLPSLEQFPCGFYVCHSYTVGTCKMSLQRLQLRKTKESNYNYMKKSLI